MRGLVLIGMLGLGIVHAQTQPPTPSSQQNALESAILTASGSGDMNQVNSLLKQGAPLEGRDSLNRTLLFLACFAHPEIVKLLLAHGARVDPVAKNGDTPIG